MNRMYRAVVPIYDLTRRYWLLGREHALRRLQDEAWSSLVEIGVGTGRNLNKLHEAAPERRYGGVDISDAMLAQARRRYPWASLRQGAAESADIVSVLGEKPDRILFSYCMSMFHEPFAALDNARRSLAPNGKVLVADFGRMDRWNSVAFRAMRGFLDTFHVFELDHDRLASLAGEQQSGLGGFWSVMSFGPLD